MCFTKDICAKKATLKKPRRGPKVKKFLLKKAGLMVAKRDITVYKDVDIGVMKCRSRVISFWYQKGRVYVNKKFEKTVVDEILDEISFSEMKMWPDKQIINIFPLEDFTFDVGKNAFHSYEHKEDNKAVFVIPKGALYIKDGCGEIISNKIKFVKEIL